MINSSMLRFALAPIEFSPADASFGLAEQLATKIDFFFFLGGVRHVFIHNEKNSLIRLRVPSTVSYEEVVVKLLLYATIVIPLVLFIIKLLIRFILHKKYHLVELFSTPLLATSPGSLEPYTTLIERFTERQQDKIKNSHSLLREVLLKTFKNYDQDYYNFLRKFGVMCPLHELRTFDNTTFFLKDFPSVTFLSLGNTIDSNGIVVKSGSRNAIYALKRYKRVYEILCKNHFSLLKVPKVSVIHPRKQESKYAGLLITEKITQLDGKCYNWVSMQQAPKESLKRALTQLIHFIRECNGLSLRWPVVLDQNTDLFPVLISSEGEVSILLNALENFELDCGVEPMFCYLLQIVPEDLLDHVSEEILKVRAGFPILSILEHRRQTVTKEVMQQKQDVEQDRTSPREWLLEDFYLGDESPAFITALSQVLDVINRKNKIQEHKKKYAKHYCEESCVNATASRFLKADIDLAPWISVQEDGSSTKKFSESLLFKVLSFLKHQQVIVNFSLFSSEEDKINPVIILV